MNKTIDIDELKSKIGERFDEDGLTYRIVNGRKILQIKEETEEDIKTNESINIVRASELSPSEFLKQLYG